MEEAILKILDNNTCEDYREGGPDWVDKGRASTEIKDTFEKFLTWILHNSHHIKQINNEKRVYYWTDFNIGKKYTYSELFKYWNFHYNK